MRMQLWNSKDIFPLSPVIETVPTTVNRTGLWRFLTPVRREKAAPCQTLCPLESGIPLWMEKAEKGRWEEAWLVMQQFNPFPALTGYACYQFCRGGCNRGKWDEPVAIREIEKALGLWRQENYRPDKPAKSAGAPRVIIVGSGPAGLSGAYYLNRMGAEVTVLEKESAAGGFPATCIPAYRLPREVLKKELEILQGEGIVIKSGVEVGRDLLLGDLARECDGLLLAVGAGRTESLGVPGDNLPGVTGAIDFLMGVNLGRIHAVSGAVIVIGGGNAAVDAATAAALGGAGEVILAYRRSEEVMPAHPEEVGAARDAGVKFLFNVLLEEIHGSSSVEGVTLSRVLPTRRGEDMQPIPGTDFTIKCQMVIGATGQQSNLPELVSAPEAARGGAALFPGSSCYLLAAGDAVTGPANIASAIFSGRQAALKLAGLLWPEDFALLPLPEPALENKEDFVPFENLNPLLYPQQRVLDSPPEEAARCFGCGTCRNCGVCWAFCPDLAVEYKNGFPELNLDYCKGCGICVYECPTGVLFMEEVDGSAK